MKIKRLEIIGFKSFVDKTVFEFPQGITAIVGPNGCGKSNVVDAIRWVMGEQSAKNLRGRSMEDVIFGGSETRKLLGMAEVSLTFSTDDGHVPAKYLNYNEIQVTRRLYRDGESEYFLNKTPCRLLDIHELFMDTGVGAKAYSVIEQGRIGMILLSKPEERRFLIEEAAGVTKFKARKQVALKKIEVTRQNLVRIGDIVAEIRRQLNSLHRQAKKAEKFRACREELKEIEILFARSTWCALHEGHERAAAELSVLNTRSAALSVDLEKGELSLEERKIVLLEEEKALTSAQQEIFRIKSNCQGCENRIEFQRRELLNLERHQERLAGELSSLERQFAEAGAELRSLEEKKGAFLSEAAGAGRILEEKEKDLEGMTRSERTLAAQLEERRRELFSLLSQLAQFGNQMNSVTKRLDAMGERFERNCSEEEGLRTRLAAAVGRSEELGRQVKLESERKSALASKIDELKRREEELKGRLEQQERELTAAREERSRKSSRLHSLQELETQLAGYGKGVRALLLSEQYRNRFAGVLADIVETGAEYEAALEAVLGERLQYIVGAGEADALAAIAFLKERSGGRCSFLVSGRRHAGPAPAPDQGLPLLGFAGIADGFRELVEPLLADVYLSPDLPSAVMLSRSYPGLTFVTADGDMAFAGGIVNGGSSDAVQQGIIHKKREIKELNREVELLSAKVQHLESGRLELNSGRAAVEEELRDKRQQLHQAEIAILNHEKDLQRVREECQRIEERLAVKSFEDAQLNEEKSLLEKELLESETGKKAAEEKKGGMELSLEDMQQSLAVQKQSIDEAREAVTAMKVRGAALREKREANLRAMQRVEGLIRDLEQRTAAHRAELDKGGQEKERLTEAVAVSEEELRVLLAQHVAAEKSLGEVRESYEANAALVRDEESRLKTLRDSAEELRRAAGEHNLAVAELEMKMRNVENSLRDKYRLEIEELRTPVDVRYDESEKLGRQAELQKLVDEMGEVNLTAIEEYQELESRYNFLTEQKGDLEESLAGLQKAIQRINRTTRKRFLETFHLVNSKFKEVFPRLFCGGQAELKLTNEDDLLETGIEIIVQPPGKKLQNVTLLSGGEKALTAVALIFSIFLIKPSPFCLLDEVDAPLDDANIGRFNEIVKEMTSFSQFIVITHSKTTMMVADTLYGVTMEDPGISKLVSVRINI